MRIKRIITIVVVVLLSFFMLLVIGVAITPNTVNTDETEKEFEPVEIEHEFEPVEIERNVEPVEVEHEFEPVEIERNVEPVEIEKEFEPVEVERGDSDVLRVKDLVRNSEYLSESQKIGILNGIDNVCIDNMAYMHSKQYGDAVLAACLERYEERAKGLE